MQWAGNPAFKILVHRSHECSFIYLFACNRHCWPLQNTLKQVYEKGKHQWSPVVWHQHITEALCRSKALVNKLPAACLKGSAYCTAMRLSTALTESQSPRAEIMQHECCWVSTTPQERWKRFFTGTCALLSRQGSPLADHGEALWLRNISPIPSWQEAPEWGGHHLAAWGIISSPALDKSNTELSCSLTLHPHLAAEQLNQLGCLAPACTPSGRKGLWAIFSLC